MRQRRLLAPAFLLALCASLPADAVVFAGEALPLGPPWHTDWRAAKREALTEGRPIFAYFTKRY